MPLLTTVIDDKSPLIVYDNTWLPGTSQDDPFASDYYLGTFTTNNVTDGSVSLNFNGTAIWIYGAKRPNHGSYAVQVDGASYTNLNSAGNNIFQVQLFNTSFSQGTHTVKLTNTATGNLYVDIDMIVWQSEVGNTGDQLVAEVVQDTDSRFQYQEPAWSTTSGTLDFNMFSNGTGHITETYDASVTFTFTGMFTVQRIILQLRSSSGEAVTIFGTSGPSNGQYSVQLDGGSGVTYNASNAYPSNYGVVIYHADNLGSGSHQVVLTNLPQSSGLALSIDYAQLWTIANNTSSPTSSQNTGSGNTASISQGHLSSGAIAGIAVAVAVAVLSAGAAIFFYLRWRATLTTRPDLYRIYTPQERPEPSMDAPTGFSSSLETRGNVSLLQNDIPIQIPAGRTQSSNSRAPQYDGAFPVQRGSRGSESVIEAASSPSQSPVDDVPRRPLPEAPGGGLSLIAEFPKLAGPRRGQSRVADDSTSIALSEGPPNYAQATGNAVASHNQ